MFARDAIKAPAASLLRADFRRPRLQSLAASAVIVLLFSLLFAAAVSSALMPRAVPDAAQAAIEGGL